ncbi:hypothetical protein HN51_030181 [Arachis hypogaea]|uniref:Uncharacterized protein n=1 Tax=Arachis hypogaea TaxID=3818 RepID=A0A445BC56_ARAHY|nr:uncharacterized protein LOC112714408 [Arachis hypogaea]QHO14635.1 uncharacterized protein DS421_10g287980 [Arachis hypogaea]RYR36255.1 hypothetical protein Ahy_A10g051258 [Arachis hypogaea]
MALFSLLNHNQCSIFLVLLLLHSTMYKPSYQTRGVLGYTSNCGEHVVQSQCSRNTRCSWCTSEVLDDMCFTKAEAWRLPHQVYSCRLIRAGSYDVSSTKKTAVKNNAMEKDSKKLRLGTRLSVSTSWGIIMRNSGGLMFLNINKLQLSSDRQENLPNSVSVMGVVVT